MKKLLALSAALLLTPLTISAISLSDIKDNPDEYVLVSQSSKGDSYVDSYSIASLRYEPPYYAMSSTVYMVLYSTNSIIKTTLTATYNYDRSFKSLCIAEYKFHPGANKNYIINLALQDMMDNDGLTTYFGAAECWDLDGNYQDSLTSSEFNTLLYLGSDSLDTDVTQCPPDTPVYHIANYMFYKGYDEYFSPKFSSKGLY